MIKKLLFFVLSILSTSAIAQNFTVGGINYNITDATNFKVEVGNNPGFTGVANIPAIVNNGGQNYDVTAIRNSAFEDCSGLTSVTIPNSVTLIKYGAFLNCTGLTTVTIPNSVTTMNEAVFSGCSGLTSVNISNSLTTIELQTFSACTGLTTVTIPNSITVIGGEAFSTCIGLTTVTIPNSVNTISNYAFSSCTALTTVNCYIQNPLAIDGNVFGFINLNNCALNVPIGSEVAYEAAAVWTNFNPINGVLATDSFVKNSFSMYPNPSNDSVNISLENNLQVEKVIIYNQLGQVVKTATTNVISTSELAKGSYFVEVITNEGKATKQLIIQ